MIERRVGLVLALLPVLGGCAYLLPSSPGLIESQSGAEYVDPPFVAEGNPDGWVMGDRHRQHADGEWRVHMIRPPETVDDHTERVMVQRLYKRAMDFDDLDVFMTRWRDQVESECPDGASLEVLEQEDRSLMYELRQENCEDEDQEGTSLGRVLDGDVYLFVVGYSVFPPLELDEARRSEWLAKLRQVEILRRCAREPCRGGSTFYLGLGLGVLDDVAGSEAGFGASGGVGHFVSNRVALMVIQSNINVERPIGLQRSGVGAGAVRFWPNDDFYVVGGAGLGYRDVEGPNAYGPGLILGAGYSFGSSGGDRDSWHVGVEYAPAFTDHETVHNIVIVLGWQVWSSASRAVRPGEVRQP